MAEGRFRVVRVFRGYKAVASSQVSAGRGLLVISCLLLVVTLRGEERGIGDQVSGAGGPLMFSFLCVFGVVCGRQTPGE